MRLYIGVALALLPTHAAASPPQVEPSGPATVVCVRNLSTRATGQTKDTCAADNVWTVRVGDRILIETKNLASVASSPTKPLRVFLANVELPNLALHRSAPDQATGADAVWTQLEFDNSPENRKAWVQVLQTARDNKRLDVSIGPEGGPPLATTAAIDLKLYPAGYTAFAVLLVVALTAVMLGLGKKSNLLRDATGAEDGPYSLAKHQMAAWFLVVIGTYLFVSLITGTAATTSSSALVLLGISGATGLAAVSIDHNKRNEAENVQKALTAERAAIIQSLDDPGVGLKAQLAKAVPGSAEATQISATMQVKMQRLSELAMLLTKPLAAPATSRGWYLDLLSDQHGISFHRLQIAGWTVVLVGIFLRAAWHDLAMPELDATTLGLMGVSSGTYLGFKFPEQKSAGSS